MVNQMSGVVGLVLSGAVAQGAFEAGVLASLAARAPRISRIAGTSSGALNAVVAAAGVATGRLDLAATVLKKLWLDDGSWQHIADVPLADWLHLRGIFNTKRLRELVRKAIGDVVTGFSGKPAPLMLTLVTTNLDALPRTVGARPLPTYEQPITFGAEEIVDPDSWHVIANAAAASATFPGLFSPTRIDGAQCIDGGAVNNTPISYVLDASDVDTVVIVTTESPTVPKDGSLGGTALLARVASALIHERIACDVRAAQKANGRYEAVARALEGAPVETRDRVLEALAYRPIALYLVQPETALPGDAFSGFSRRDQRSAYLLAGEQAPMVRLREGQPE